MQIPKAQKNTDNLGVFFALLGSERIKDADQYNNEIDPWCQFQQYFIFVFLYKSDFYSFFLLTFWLRNFLAK